MVMLSYQGYRSWLVNNNYVASSVDNFEVVLYNGVTVVIEVEPEIIKLELKK